VSDLLFWSGYHLGVLNTSLSYVARDLDFSVAISGAIVVSTLLVGASVGALFAGQVADRVGPGKALQINNLFFVAGCICSAVSPWGFWGMNIGVQDSLQACA
jgi:MFS family permease